MNIVNGNAAVHTGIFDSGGTGGGISSISGRVTITNSIVSNNVAGTEDGPPFPAGYGGGISNAGTLTITNSTISGNSAGLVGGGISNGGSLTITNSTSWQPDG